MIGRTLSHFKLIELLGAGGMGVVYRARDERLERDVAIKVLPAGALANDASRRQFRQEALALSKLNHPNIGTVYDFDTQEAIDFLVLELVSGETLAERVERGPLPEAEVLRLGEQLADGLASAHAAGVLHRDLKPANIRMTPDGRAKILDFGLAKLLRPAGEITITETDSGRVAGTIPYMSPEHLHGQRLDGRSDVYALGAVLYEMATGRRAFPQDSSAQVIQSILNEAPARPRAIREISPELERVILRCLEKDPRDRYASARELAAELRSLGAPLPSVLRPPRRRHSWHMIEFTAVGIIVVLGVLFALDLGGWRDRLTKRAGTEESSLAVLPLANLSGDPSQEYFADGMTDELITRLAQVGALTVLSRSSTMQYKGSKKTPRAIARELHVHMIMEGSVAREGALVRISAQLVEGSSGRNVWAESYEQSSKSVLLLQSEVARSIVEKVRVRVTPEERARLTSARAVNPEAHEAYLRGLAHFNEFSSEGSERAVEEFNRCIQIDPSYAPAYAALAQTYSVMAGVTVSWDEANARARPAARRSLELDPNLAAGHVALGYVKMSYDWDWAGAEAGFRRALALNPGEITAHQDYGALLVALRRFQEAEREFARARQLDPLSPLVASMSVWPLFEGRQYDRAIRAAERVVEMDPSGWNPRMVLGQALLFKGERARAIAELEKATQLERENPFVLGWLGYAYAVSGQREKAHDVWKRLRHHESYVQPYILALVQTGLGNKAEALDWVEKAYAEHSDEIGFLNVDPGMDPLRSERRFQAIIKKLAFPG